MTFKYKLAAGGRVQIDVMDISGRLVNTINEGVQPAGEHLAQWNAGQLMPGNYFARFSIGGSVYQTVKMVKAN